MEIKQLALEGHLWDSLDRLMSLDYSFIFMLENHFLVGAQPFLIFESRGHEISLHWRNRKKEHFKKSDPLKFLNQCLAPYLKGFSKTPLFQGGMAGAVSYDAGRSLERLPVHAIDDQKLPEICMGFYDCAYLYPYNNGTGSIIAIALEEETTRDVQLKISSLASLLKSLPSSGPDKKLKRSFCLTSHMTSQQYIHVVQRAKDYIASGDIYQVNLSQKFSGPCHENPYKLFQGLIRQYPAPHASFFRTGLFSLVSLSPERLMKIEDKKVLTSPIKGTRRRGRTPAEDEKLKEELNKSPKDNAELLMIVDLERNDLGKVCEYESIRVRTQKRIETHPSVFHMVADIEGTLQKDVNHLDCLRALFPGGSITGAPKLRAMEIIEELEPTRRSFYTGALGFMGFNQYSDFSILIRTLICQNSILSFQVGGAIVSDSVPELEYEETLDKGRSFFDFFRCQTWE